MERIYSDESMIGGISFSQLKLNRIDPNWNKAAFVSKLSDEEKTFLRSLWGAQQLQNDVKPLRGETVNGERFFKFLDEQEQDKISKATTLNADLLSVSNTLTDVDKTPVVSSSRKEEKQKDALKIVSDGINFILKEWQEYKRDNQTTVETLNADAEAMKKRMSMFGGVLTEMQNQQKSSKKSLNGINSTVETNKLGHVTDVIVRINAFESMIRDYFQDQVHQFIVILNATDS